jgi:hypothetical protein
VHPLVIFHDPRNSMATHLSGAVNSFVPAVEKNRFTSGSPQFHISLLGSYYCINVRAPISPSVRFNKLTIPISISVIRQKRKTGVSSRNCGYVDKRIKALLHIIRPIDKLNRWRRCAFLAEPPENLGAAEARATHS